MIKQLLRKVRAFFSSHFIRIEFEIREHRKVELFYALPEPHIIEGNVIDSELRYAIGETGKIGKERIRIEQERERSDGLN